MRSEVRDPLVAGIFYPSSKEECAQLFDSPPSDKGKKNGTGEQAQEERQEAVRMAPDEVQTLLLPHAAYEYILPYLIDGFELISRRSPAPRRIIAIGAAHREKRSGVFLSPHTAFRSPAGELTLDRETRDRVLAEVDGALLDETLFEEEHVLDTLLPPLSLYFPETELLPVLAGDESRATVQALTGLLELAEEEDSLVLISANLSAETDAANLETRSGAFISALTADGNRMYKRSETDKRQAAVPSLLRLGREGRIDSCGTAAAAAVIGLHPDYRVSILRWGTSLSGEDTTGVGFGAAALSYEKPVQEAQNGTRTHG